jgi:hypothetical protein
MNGRLLGRYWPRLEYDINRHIEETSFEVVYCNVYTFHVLGFLTSACHWTDTYENLSQNKFTVYMFLVHVFISNKDGSHLIAPLAPNTILNSPRHIWGTYRGLSLSIPSWHQSASCANSHRDIAVPNFLSSLHLEPPRYCSNTRNRR